MSTTGPLAPPTAAPADPLPAPAAAAPQPAGPGLSSTAAHEPRRRSSRVLMVLLVLAVIAAVVVVALRGSYRDGPLEPTAPTGQGSKAVAEVLRDGGTDVEVRRFTADAASALSSGRTVLVTDPSALGDAQLDRLAEAQETGHGHLILVRPSFFVLHRLAPGISPAGSLSSTTDLTAGASCGPAAFEAGTLRVGPVDDVAKSATLYRTSGEAGTAYSSCFGHGGGAAVVIGRDVTVLGSATLLTNDSVGEADNAAVALNALGADGPLTWYVPSPTDPLSEHEPSLLDRLPDFTLPLALWIVVVALMVLLAVSRRLGPVVVEPLPVSVRARELTIGRANLLHRADARDAAARSLRSATSLRLASRLGVRREERLETLLAALAPHTALPPEQLRTLLGPTPVRSDEELLRLTEGLDALEKEIDR